MIETDSRFSTRHTLISRIHDPSDNESWSEFVDIYEAFIARLIGRMNVPQCDVDDLSQQILISLTQNVHKYDRRLARFRTWLARLIRNAVLNHFKKEKARERLKKNSVLSSMLGNTEESRVLDEYFENEWALFIAKTAMDRVRQSFRGESVAVYQLFLSGLSAGEIAEQKELSVSSVYTMIKRVKSKLYDEIRVLRSEIEYEF